MAVIKFKKPGQNKYIPDLSVEEADIPEERQEKDGYLKRIRRHRRFVFARTAIGILLLAALAVAVYIQIDSRIFSGVSYKKIGDVTRSLGTGYKMLGSHVLVYSRDGASCIDPEGKAVWNITYEMQRPILDQNGEVAAIADYNGSSVYVVGEKGILGTVNTNMPVRGISVAGNGEVAAVLGDTSVTWVYLYSKDGQEIAHFKMSMDQTGYPVATAISPGGEMVAVSHLLPDGSNMKSSVAFYNFGSVGQNEVDNYVSGFDYTNEIVPVLHFITDSSSFAVSDSRIVFFQGKEIPQSGETVFFSEELKGVYYGDGYAALLFPDTSGEHTQRLDVYNAKGVLVSSVGISMDFSDVQIAYGRIYIYDDQECMIYDIDGRLKFKGAFGRNVMALIPSAKIDRMTVITEEGVERLTLN